MNHGYQKITARNDMRRTSALNKQEIKMIAINGTYAMASAMTAVFVNVYLYKFTGSLVTMTAYAMVRFGFFPIAFTIGAHIGRKYRLSLTMTAGLLLIVCGLLVLLTLRERIGELGYAIYGIGVIFGMGEGFFWLSTVSLNQLVSTKESRGKYLGYMGMFNGLTNIIAPLFAAQIVAWSPNDTEGYLRIFQLVIVLYLIIAYLASTIHEISQKGKFTVLDKVFQTKDKQWSYIFNSHLLFGIRDSLVLMLTGLLIYRATGGSGSTYGRLLAFFALISIASFYLSGKIINRQNRIKMYQYGAIFTSISTIILVVFPTTAGAIAFGILASLVAPFYVIPFQIITMNATSDYMEKENILGYVISKEIGITSGRLLGMLTIITFSFIFPEEIFLPLAVIFCSMFPVILVIYATIYHRRRDREKAMISD
ncbi:MAG: MFS transporter [Firmicutes bacterium HGW-Firmicutes-20]|jgi:MFS family permease|nr:MAG: MFS transporter [Firmicutes bacterium HGW-Firmicutes-20]PKM90332.1 MAG: MFS transporter [Firmicutes bacterium HGW-Firmicutes-10]